MTEAKPIPEVLERSVTVSGYGGAMFHAPDLIRELEDAAYWLRSLALIARRDGNTELANLVTEQASKAFAAIAKARGEAA